MTSHVIEKVNLAAIVSRFETDAADHASDHDRAVLGWSALYTALTVCPGKRISHEISQAVNNIKEAIEAVRENIDLVYVDDSDLQALADGAEDIYRIAQRYEDMGDAETGRALLSAHRALTEKFGREWYADLQPPANNGDTSSGPTEPGIG